MHPYLHLEQAVMSNRFIKRAISAMIIGSSFFFGIQWILQNNIISEKAISFLNENNITRVSTLQDPEPLPPPPKPSIDCNIQKCVALTFDDGPDPKLTPKYLKILSEADIKATFFMIGRSVKEYPKVAKTVADEGHKICNHSWSHPDLSNMSVIGASEQLNKTQKVIDETIGIKDNSDKCFRAPYGAIPKQLLKETEWVHIGWHADSDDYFRTDANTQVKYVLKQVKENKNPIILFHDIHKIGLKSVPIIIEQLKSDGYTFVTIDELDLKPHVANTAE